MEIASETSGIGSETLVLRQLIEKTKKMPISKAVGGVSRREEDEALWYRALDGESHTHRS